MSDRDDDEKALVHAGDGELSGESTEALAHESDASARPITLPPDFAKALRQAAKTINFGLGAMFLANRPVIGMVGGVIREKEEEAENRLIHDNLDYLIDRNLRDPSLMLAETQKLQYLLSPRYELRDVRELIAAGGGDVDELATLRVAQLRAAGELEARLEIVRYDKPLRRVTVVVRRADGSVERMEELFGVKRDR